MLSKSRRVLPNLVRSRAKLSNNVRVSTLLVQNTAWMSSDMYVCVCASSGATNMSAPYSIWKDLVLALKQGRLAEQRKGIT